MYIHVICFDQPYPPAYGGAVEMFYKLKAMHEAGFKIILHIFMYNNAKKQIETEQLAVKTYYYERQTGIKANISLKPYIVVSRNNKQLLHNLCKDSYPVLFEGLHTTFFIKHPQLKERIKMVRTHNIEHTFYMHLAKNNPLSWQAIFFVVEAIRLKMYEKTLRHATKIFAISHADTEELKKRYPDNDVRLLNCFFDNKIEQKNDCDTHTDNKKYILYHANLAVTENQKAATYIVKHIAEKMQQHSFVITGRKPNKKLIKLCEKHNNVTLIENPQQEQLQKLIKHAHINLMLTFQPTGIKLKLLTTLAKSEGYCIANKHMLHGNNLEQLCHRADTDKQIINTITQLMMQNKQPDIISQRLIKLNNLGFGTVEEIMKVYQND